VIFEIRLQKWHQKKLNGFLVSSLTMPMKFKMAGNSGQEGMGEISLMVLAVSLSQFLWNVLIVKIAFLQLLAS